MNRRVVVTGVGVVSPLGASTADTWRGLCEGVSGAGYITRFDAQEYDVRIAAEAWDFDPAAVLDPKSARRMDRFCQMAIAAGLEAIRESGLDIAANADRIGTCVCSGIGGMATWETQYQILLEKGPSRVSPFLIPMLVVNMASGNLAIEVGARGPSMTVISACASSLHGIGESYHMIKRGDADAMLAGGAEAAVTRCSVAGFGNMKAISTRNDDPKRASRPFDRERDGFVIGEGAAVLVLEEYEAARARGAEMLGEIRGYGASADAFHMTLPAENHEGAQRAMRSALASAGLAPGDIGYVNAHGTSTQMNDAREAVAIREVFGAHADHLPVSSTKSMTGHLLGAAGAAEVFACLYGMKHGVIPPTINYEYPDPDCRGLDFVPNVAREATYDNSMCNSFGFGGQNAVLIVSKV
ncbi:MAG: beta-ketoacyl-ACP synthase II [Armatimonadetes bacterium]|nr:beta-ketoacyl-ACP synthase II [Armatimonadota bacterium]MDI9601209.1 beta-ketoacyl-ACP synthase II [Acidobacteriota bacterium]